MAAAGRSTVRTPPTIFICGPTLGPSQRLALSGTMAWLVFVEGAPRPWTIAAGWTTLATLLLLGVLVSVRPGRYNKYLVSVIHLVYVVLVTRVADVTDSALTVVVAALLLLGLGGLTAVVAARTYSPAELSS